MNRTFLTRLAVVLALIFSAALVYLFPEGDLGVDASVYAKNNCKDGYLCVHFLDVGQGDATLIESPSGVQVLIDGGPDSNVLRELSGAMGFFDREIDMVIATHPDLDHIGGLIDVLERYRVDTIVLTENKSDTTVSDMFDTYVDDESAQIIYARKGQVFDLGLGKAGTATLAVLFPDRDPSEFESNTASVIARLSYGDTDFIFTGDAPATVEEYLVEAYGSGLQSEVLKVGHHGSRTSTDEDFLTAVAPQYAIISAGKDNRYGHPHIEVTDMLFNHHAETKSTAETGTITIESDGKTVLLSD